MIGFRFLTEDGIRIFNPPTTGGWSEGQKTLFACLVGAFLIATSGFGLYANEQRAKGLLDIWVACQFLAVWPILYAVYILHDDMQGEYDARRAMTPIMLLGSELCLVSGIVAGMWRAGQIKLQIWIEHAAQTAVHAPHTVPVSLEDHTVEIGQRMAQLHRLGTVPRTMQYDSIESF